MQSAPGEPGVSVSHSPVSWAVLSPRSRCGKPTSKDQKSLSEGPVFAGFQTGGQDLNLTV